MLRVLLILLTCLAGPALAHFSQGTQLREVVLQPDPEGDRLWVRAPLPLLFADVIDVASAEGAPLVSEFLRLEQTGAGPRYRVLAEVIAARPEQFAARLLNSLELSRDGEVLSPELGAVSLAAQRPDDSFDSAEAARAAVNAPSVGLDPVFSDAVVSYALRLPPGEGPLSLRNPLPELTLPETVQIDHHLTRDTGLRQMTATHSGQLTQPARFPVSGLSALLSFAKHGLMHIVTGYDHVFLVICFALGIGWSRQLFWVVTAFTLGHSVTLVLGATGLVPQAAWFIPAVEAAIAASVVIAAIAAWRQDRSLVKGALPAAMAGGVGLIHGFGFASFLSESLTPGMSGFLPALAGFNLGLELGQILLVTVAVALFALILRASARAEAVSRMLVLGAIAVVAGMWTLERVVALVQGAA